MKLNILWNKNDKLGLALSGGVDSVVLFHLLIDKYKDSYKELVVFHINHGLRTESYKEATFVESLAQKNKVKFYKKELHLKEKSKEQHISEEMQARSLRYQAFEEFAGLENVSKLVTAHHRNDCVENIILRLFSGRTIDYRLSIEEATIINNIEILRPMLNISKQDIEKYASQHNIKFYQDMTNFDTDYTRNYVRHKIVPHLAAINKGAEENLLEFATYYNDLNDLVRLNTLSKFIPHINKINDSKYQINLADFDILHNIEKYFLINYIINEKFNNFNVSRRAIFTALKNLASKKANISLDLKENIKLIKEYQSISVCKIEKKCYNNRIEILANDIYDGFSCDFGDYKIIITRDNNKAELGFNQSDLPLLLAPKQDGDTIKRGNIHKKIARIFIDEKIPKSLRDRLPVVKNKEGQALGVLGIGSKISKNSKYDYYLRLLKG
ncbi:tRNA lysidine(34) synthetase TilS [Gemella sp. zg-570]|uniref:tRNA lysidine(34) synthetase TilS n=1 Tax=Gemella sp. zg-570 TaxID=2840371 RepID=UPI001C0B3DBE|nr:tRNA lysidine(34) synthetase TilS [Gemella sp. zg-570]QWQ38844.1 tRNA lysidine(34) synthetase TilS [Gemella sp. zg-570]